MKIITRIGVKNQIGSPIYQYLATITGCLSIVCMGMHFGWPSPSLPQLLGENSHIPISNDDGSWMAVMPCIGAVGGSLLNAYLVDKIGRKISMLVTSPLYFISWMMIAFSSSVSLLNGARFLAGFSDGMIFTALPIYLGEIANSNIRGLLVSSIPVTTMFGLLLINIIGSYLSITQTALISSIIPILHFVTFYYMPESPYYLIMSDKFDEARKNLQIFRGQDDVNGELKILENAVKEDLKNTGKIWDLFTIKSNRKSIWIIVGMRAAQQCSGVNAINFYAKIIFQEAGDTLSPSIASIIYFLVQLLIAIISSFLVDKLGRRPLLIISIIGSAFALFAEGVYFYFDKCTDFNMTTFSILPLIALLIYVIAFNIGMGTIPVLMLGELFPTSVKAFALCLADIYFGIIVTIVSKLFQFMKDEFGMHIPFFMFTICCIFGLFFIIFSVPETKGKTLEEIQEYLKGKSPKNNNDAS